MTPPLLMLVAGEASGDMQGAALVSALKQKVPDLEVFGLGGGLMAAAGVKIEQDLVSHAVIGIIEAIRKLGDFLAVLRLTRKLLRERRPAALILIDFPDLNFRIAAQAKALGIPVIYYISPQVWAWRRGRVHTLKRLVDRMIVIFPFEAPLYEAQGVPVTFVGHPLLDIAKAEGDVDAARQELLGSAPGPLIALLPGSRTQEIENLLPVMAAAGREVLRRFPHARFFVPVARTVSAARVSELLTAAGLPAALVDRQPYRYRAAADVALVASGTATLETAILGVPMVIAYRMNALSYWLARRFVKLPYFGLANLAAGEKIAPEFLQQQVTPKALADALGELITQPEARQAQQQGWLRTRARLGGPGAAGRAADAVLKVLAERSEKKAGR